MADGAQSIQPPYDRANRVEVAKCRSIAAHPLTPARLCTTELTADRPCADD
jgi:hypothetical protein